MGKSKYGNRKATVDGITFDSRREARRYCELKLMLKAKEITDLQLQVKFELIPEQREPATERYKAGKNKGEFKPGKLIEKPIVYIADFVYKQNGEMIVEDAKGLKTREYIIKRKLMRYIHGISIKEV